MARRGAARVAVVVALVALLASCTRSPSPAPSPGPSPSETAADGPAAITGDRIAVLVPPSSVVAAAEAAALARAARELADDPPEGVADVRVVEARSEAFVRDLANLAVDDGYDVVCVVGTGSAELALELARERRDARFCTTDARIAGGPVNLVAVAPDPAVLVQTGAIAIGTSAAPVGLLLSAQVGDVEALAATFTDAVAPPTQPSPPPAVPTEPAPEPAPTATSPAPTASPPVPTSPQPTFVTATPGPSAAAQLTAGEQLAGQRPSRVLVLATPGGSAAATAVGSNGAAVVGVADWLVDAEGQLPPNLLVGLTVDWGVLLQEAIAAAREEEPAQVQLRGMQLLQALPGQARGAASAADRTTAFLEQSTG